MEEHRRGETAAAGAKYSAILAADPENWDVLFLHATALLQLGRPDEAVAALTRAAAARPEVPDVHNNLGVAYQAAGDWQNAARSYQAAIRAKPDYDRAVFNLGRLMESRKLLADAEKCFRQAVVLRPGDKSYRVHLAAALSGQSKWAEAEQVWSQLAAINPESLDLRVNQGYALVKLDRLDEAAELYHHILAMRPDYYQIHSNLSFVLERQGKLDEALAAAQRAVELRPDYPEAFNNLGTAHSLHRLDEACAAFRKALELKPDFHLAQFNLGSVLLLSGRFAEGWAGHRRYREVTTTPVPVPPTTEWEGEPIPGRRMLIYADQGLGDSIQFARFLPAAKKRSHAEIVLRCQKALVRLFDGLPGTDRIIPQGTDPPDCEFHCPLASLPGILRCTAETVSLAAATDGPVLRANESLRPELAELLEDGSEGRLRVGLVWQGNPRVNPRLDAFVPAGKASPALNSSRDRLLQPADR